MTHSPGHRPKSPSPHGGGSQAGDSQSAQGAKAPKDKQCPFCHQSFTSSSLGRHLDLYIKPKNPKPPDGIHDVRKIREMRGKITRRQPRNSLKKQEHDQDDHDHDHDHDRSYGSESPEQTIKAPVAQSHPEILRPLQTILPGPVAMRKLGSNDRDAEMLSPATFSGNPDALRRDERVKHAFGTANWQGTGVIVGLPQTSADMDRFQRPPRNEYDSGTRLPSISSNLRATAAAHSYTSQLEGDETGKAAQLALREVLDSLEAARSHAKPFAALFDFDYFGHTFPSLCLKILPSPRTLFSLHPFSTAETWPLDPPHEPQLHALRDAVTARAASAGLDAHTSAEVQRALRHLETSATAWLSLGDDERHRAWHLETLRAFSKAQRKIGERTTELKLARQQAEYFRLQHEKLVRMLDPKDAYWYAASPLPVAAEVQEDLERRDPEARAWSYEGLIGKWRGRLRENGGRSGGGGGGVGGVDSTGRSPAAGPDGWTQATAQQQQQQNGTGTASGSQTGASPAAYGYGASPTMAPPLRMEREREVRWLWDDGCNGRDGQKKYHGGIASGGAPQNGTAEHKERDVPRRDSDKDRPAEADTPREGTEWMDAASQAVERVLRKDRGGTTRGGQAAAGSEMDVDGRPEAERDKEVNGNGKRPWPPSWHEPPERPASAMKVAESV